MSNKKLIVGALVGVGTAVIAGTSLILKKARRTITVDDYTTNGHETQLPSWLLGEWSVKNDLDEEQTFTFDAKFLIDSATGGRYYFTIDEFGPDNQAVALSHVFEPHDGYVIGQLADENQAYMADKANPLKMRVLTKKA